MADGGHPIEPGWLQLAVATFTGFMGAMGIAFTSAWRLSNQLHALELKIAALRRDIVEDHLPKTRLMVEQKLDENAEKTDERLRNLETQMAAMTALNRMHFPPAE